MGTAKNYNTIDIGKFLACIGIVALHVSPFYVIVSFFIPL